MPTPRWSILFRPFPRDGELSWAPGHRPDRPPDPRPESADRLAGGRALGLAPGGAGADLDRIGGPTTTAAARRLAADWVVGPGPAAARVRPAGVPATFGGVVGGVGSAAAGSGAAPVRVPGSPARDGRVPAAAGRAVADHRA